MMEPMDVLLPFVKGHATGNDFLLLPDPDGALALTPAQVAAICDRRRGVGADGILRVVRTAAEPEVAGDPTKPEWFMDYRNADGSLADMCGNGARLFARYLVHSGLAAGPVLPLLTRAGVVVAEVGADRVAVQMPLPRVYGGSTVRVAGDELKGTIATCGNPNLVCPVEDPDQLDLHAPMELDAAAFPDGANVEFVAATADGIRLRVVERGVGETLSCGSGACAAAAVALAESGGTGQVRVRVPGGELLVTLDPDRCVLAGPAVMVATGTLTLPPR
jgi:diaminopimelate epimerase